MKSFVVALLLVLLVGAVTVTGKRLSRQERLELKKREADAYLQLRRIGVSEVDHTKEGKTLRDYRLRKKKRKGLIRKRETDLTSILFPGVTPELYKQGEPVFMITELVQSKRTHVPFEFYDLPGCEPPPFLQSFKRSSSRHQRKNLGARLQGVELKPAPYQLKVLQDRPCTRLCDLEIDARSVKWLRKLVAEQYRVHLTFDNLPLLMRSSDRNYAVRGYPIGFRAPPAYTGNEYDEFFYYNHLKFTVTYQQVPEQDGIYITGFDVYPVSVLHTVDSCPLTLASWTGQNDQKRRRRLEEMEEDEEAEDEGPPETDDKQGDDKRPLAGDNAEEEDEEEDQDNNDGEDGSPVNDPETYLPLRVGAEGGPMKVILSYQVQWKRSELSWADRWDVYLIGSPDDDIHFFAIINSLMIVLFLTGAIATIMIRTLRKDISAYNEMIDDAGAEETGWKLVHGDVFRPPSTSPLALSVLVGTGAQIGMAFFITMLAAIIKLVNPVKKGHTLTAIVVVYVLCGSVSGYVSARLYKFCEGKNWKMNTLATAAGLPGFLVAIFTVLNVFLSFAGAATAMSFWMLLAIFALWVCVSAPLVFVGSFFGYREERIHVPTKTHQIARIVPKHNSPWFSIPPVSFLIGGILPFGSVCIELFFIMSALWLHQIYYVMGFLLAVLLILAATCAQVSIVMDYLQLCAEDHRWWWKSFFNCASAGVYLFAYSLWFLVKRLDLVGFLPVLVYLTYMSLISLCFGLFCGSVGLLCAFQFNRIIYGALKVD